MIETLENENAGDGSIPKKGIVHDPLDGITPEMWETAKPRIKGMDLKGKIIYGTSGCPTKDMFLKAGESKLNGIDIHGYFEDEAAAFLGAKWDVSPHSPFHWNNRPEVDPNYKGMTEEDLKEAVRIMRNSFQIELVIYHAEGYFVGEFKVEGRPGKTKTGWKGLRDFISKHNTTDFKVTYNGVTYEPEDNEKLFDKIFKL